VDGLVLRDEARMTELLPFTSRFMRMNNSRALSLVALLSYGSLLLPHCAVAADTFGPKLKVWSAAAAQKVFREDNQPANAEAEIRLDAAANETESAQVVLRAQGNDLIQALIARATTDLNTYTTDPALLDALRREMAGVIEGNSSGGR
jgi:hypothetical protein